MIAVIIKIMIVCALIGLLSMVIDNLRFVVRRYKLVSSRVHYPVKLVFIADLHEKCYGEDNEEIVEAVRKEDPDAILVGGDLIVSGTVKKLNRQPAPRGEGAQDTEVWMTNSLSLMKRLAETAPVWFVQGNHELRLEYYDELHEYDAQFRREMEKAGVRFLHNGSADPGAEKHGGTPSGIVLRGLELPMDYYQKFKKTRLPGEKITEMLGKADRSAYTVLLTHTPVHFKTYAEWGADLCLCGHVHGGLMRLPLVGGVMGTRPNLFPEYSDGQYFRAVKTDGENHLSSMIVTCGLGMHTLPIRIFNPGEISVVEIRPADDDKAS